MKIALLTVMIAPQLWAAYRRHGPAAHLTLLLLSLTGITAFFVFASFASFPMPGDQGTVDVNLSYLGFAAIGLTGLVPLYWALEQMFPTYDFTPATALAQALGVVFAVTLVTMSVGASLPSVLEWAALALVVALYGAGLHVVHYGELK